MEVNEARGRLGTDTPVVTSWQALAKFCQNSGAERDPLAGRTILAYGWRESKECQEFASKLTRGAISGIKPANQSNSQISFAPAARDLSGPLAGMKFDARPDPGRVSFLLAGEGRAIREILSCDGEPIFVEIELAGARIYFLGTDRFADLGARLEKGFSLTDEVEALAPLIMFVRKHFGQRCWHAEKVRACLIIDDPLLRSNYGFLNYSELLRSMESHHYATSIAFIPWNYRRTDPAVARVFREFPNRLSICVHGCDHTGGEFATTHEPELRQLLHSALWRMEQHQNLSGVPFDPVMVFPQGRFSHAAMRALGDSRLWAAINSTPFPTDYDGAALTLADLCEPAITSFSECTLFVRRYPKNPAEFAFDLFLGKPLLMVEHHQCFQDGTKTIEEFIGKLNALDDSIEWASPAAICSQACLRRQTGEKQWETRFYTDQFCLANHHDQPADFTFVRRMSPGRKIESIRIDGKTTEWHEKDGDLRFSARLAARQKASVAIARAAPPPLSGAFHRGPINETKVSVRRHLSEFRDNFVDKSPLATKAVRAARALVKGR